MLVMTMQRWAHWVWGQRVTRPAESAEAADDTKKRSGTDMSCYDVEVEMLAMSSE